MSGGSGALRDRKSDAILEHGSVVLLNIFLHLTNHRSLEVAMSQSSPSFTLNHLHRLQLAAGYYTFLNLLRAAGLRMVYFGSFFCCLAFVSLRYPFGFLPFLLIGLWLVWYGFAIHRSALLQNQSLFDRAFIAIGLLNAFLLLYETLMFPPASGQIARSSIGLPIQAIIWFVFPWLYKRSLKHVPPAPDPEALGWLKQIAQELRQKAPKTRANSIAFSIEHQGRQLRYKGLLGADIGIVIDERGKEIVVLAKRDIQITTRSQSTTHKKQIPVNVHFGNQKLIGRISGEAFTRYQQWKESVDPVV